MLPAVVAPKNLALIKFYDSALCVLLRCEGSTLPACDVDPSLELLIIVMQNTLGQFSFVTSLYSQMLMLLQVCAFNSWRFLAWQPLAVWDATGSSSQSALGRFYGLSAPKHLGDGSEREAPRFSVRRCYAARGRL